MTNKPDTSHFDDPCAADGVEWPVTERARTARLEADQKPWVHIARRVVQGEFAGADRSTRDSLVIGLKSLDHPLCRQALTYLNPETKHGN